MGFFLPQGAPPPLGQPAPFSVLWVSGINPELRSQGCAMLTISTSFPVRTLV